MASLSAEVDPRVTLADGVAGQAEAALAALDSVRVVIRLGQRLNPTAARAAFALLAMLRRLHAHVELDGDARLERNPWMVESVASGLDVLARLAPTPTVAASRDVIIAVGDDVSDASWWLGGDDWTLLVARQRRPVGAVHHGAALHLGAALLAGEIFKEQLIPLGMVGHRAATDVVWNLIDYRLRPAPSLEYVAVNSALAVLGGGSVGSSTVGVLSCADSNDGTTAVVVDPDTFDPVRNPFRYPLALGSEAGWKAEWLRDVLRAAGCAAEAANVSVKQWVTESAEPGCDGIVVSSVDTVDGRLEVADVLPRTTLSVAVRALALHVQREHLGDGLACPACEYVDERLAIGQTEIYAQLTGLSSERVAEILATGQPLAVDDVDRVQAQRGLAPGTVAEMVGRRIQDLVHRLYAATEITPAATERPIQVNAPHVSWAAGSIAAAEVLKAASGLPLVDRRVELDLAGVPQDGTHRHPADRSGRCLCASPVRRRWMRRLYP